MSKVRVLLADDHPEVLATVTRLLEPAFEVVGTATDGQAVIQAATQLRPDVLVLDISMPVLSGIEAAGRLKEAGCTSKIVFLTVHTDPDFIRACLATGAFGYVVKAHMASDLARAIREVHAGRIFVSPTLGSRN